MFSIAYRMSGRRGLTGPPPGHPESLTAEPGDDSEEEYLGCLAARLWPRDEYRRLARWPAWLRARRERHPPAARKGQP